MITAKNIRTENMITVKHKNRKYDNSENTRTENMITAKTYERKI